MKEKIDTSEILFIAEAMPLADFAEHIALAARQYEPMFCEFLAKVLIAKVRCELTEEDK